MRPSSFSATRLPLGRAPRTLAPWLLLCKVALTVRVKELPHSALNDGGLVLGQERGLTDSAKVPGRSHASCVEVKHESVRLAYNVEVHHQIGAGGRGKLYPAQVLLNDTQAVARPTELVVKVTSASSRSRRGLEEVRAEFLAEVASGGWCTMPPFNTPVIDAFAWRAWGRDIFAIAHPQHGGRSLYDTVLLAGGTFDTMAMRDAMAQAALGLLGLHRAGYVHNDFRPANLVMRDGRSSEAQSAWSLVGHGLAGKFGEPMSPSRYAPTTSSEGWPETDWAAWAATIYEWVVGESHLQTFHRYVVSEGEKLGMSPSFHDSVEQWRRCRGPIRRAVLVEALTASRAQPAVADMVLLLLGDRYGELRAKMIQGGLSEHPVLRHDFWLLEGDWWSSAGSLASVPGMFSLLPRGMGGHGPATRDARRTDFWRSLCEQRAESYALSGGRRWATCAELLDGQR